MPKYYGVTCKTKGCGTTLALGTYEPGTRTEAMFYAAPLEPLRCPVCKNEAQYESEAIFHFEAADDVPLIQVRPKAV
jgi:hypothetical protein